MDARTFLAHFGSMVNAPGGIDQIRQMTYQLAVTGALTKQKDEPEPASMLLASIETMRRRLIADKQYKRIRKLEKIPIRPPTNIRLPETWAWSRLLDIGEINPINDIADDEPAAFVPMSGVSQFHGKAVAAEVRPWGEIRKGYKHFAEHDVVLAKITPCFENGKAATIGKLTVASGIGAGTTELHVFRPIHKGVVPAYVYIFLRSPMFTAEGQRNMTGTAGQKRLPTDYFAARAFPLPPTEEQARIVAKVDKLMALCDQLEAQQQARRQLQNQLRRASLDALAQAESPHELQTSWQRLASHFGHLFSNEEDVNDLRAAVLDLAITGVLSSKATNNEPVERLIARCEAAKADRIESGGMKRKKPKATTVKQHDWVIPRHWGKAAFTQLFQFIDYRGKTPTKTASGVVLVTAKNVRPGHIAKEPVEYLSEQSYEEWMTRGFPQQGDLLFTTEAPMGNVARIESAQNFALAQRIICLQPFADINTKCLMYFLMSPMFQQVLEINGTGMTAKGIKAAKLKQIAIPISPVEEQARIVKRVDSLLQLCGELSRQLGTANAKAEHLAAAAIATLTGIDTTEAKEPPMHLPKTTLNAPVRLSKTPGAKDTAPLAAILLHTDGQLDANDLYQGFGGEIDAFYAQLKTEVAHGWIEEPTPATVRELASETTEA